MANYYQNVGCPNCGSTNIQIINNIEGSTKGYGVGKGCLGYLCFGPWGWLCGLCGMGKGKTTTTTYRMCANCGAKFK